MYLSTSSSNGLMNYVPHQETDQDINKNIQVCTGGFSGSDSNYYTYKSNCYPLMTQRCSIEWDNSCASYLNQINDQEARLFLNSVKTYPTSDTRIHKANPVYTHKQSEYEREQLRMLQRSTHEPIVSLNQPIEIGLHKPTGNVSLQYQEPMYTEHTQHTQLRDIIKQNTSELNHISIIESAPPSTFEDKQAEWRQFQRKQNMLDTEQNDALKQEAALHQEEADRIQELFIQEENVKQQLEQLQIKQDMYNMQEVNAREFKADQERQIQENITTDAALLQLEQNILEENKLRHIKEQQYQEQAADFYDFITKDSLSCNHSCDVSKLL
jgi:hypothetical protein